MFKRAVAVSAAGLVLSLPLARPAAAQEIACGSSLSGTVVLQADVDCWGQQGITLADGLDLDLNGFRIRGDVSSRRFDEVAIANGEIDHWTSYGASAEMTDVRLQSIDMSGGSLQALRVDIESIVLAPTGSETVRVRDSWIGSTNAGSAHTIDIEGSRIGRMDVSQGHVRLVDNEVRSFRAIGGGTLELRDNDVPGLIILTNSQTAVVDGNDFNGPRSGLVLKNAGGEMDVVNNRFNDGYHGPGLRVEGWSGSGHLDISHNRLVGTWSGLRISGPEVPLAFPHGGPADEEPPSDVPSGPPSDVTIDVRNNRIVDVNGSGLTVDWTNPIGRPSNVTVAGNVAARNGGRGIDAPGVTDGGGNRAAGNELTPECIGVTCAPK